MGNEDGRSPSGPGHSRAEPEEVSALRASVPNAVTWDKIEKPYGWVARAKVDDLTALVVEAHESYSWSVKENGEPVASGEAWWLDGACDEAASAIEARRAATAKTGAVHESAVAASETPNLSPQGHSHD